MQASDAGNCLRASSVSKWYPQHDGQLIHVLADISLTIPKGKVVGIIGPSGCGKTTLLRVLAHLEPPTTGEVFYPATGNVPIIPIVFQSPALLPWRSALQNIALSLELLKVDNPTLQAEAFIPLLGLEGFADFLPKDLSGGMKARVSIGRALAAASELVFFDEAFTELDEVTRQKLNDLFCRQIEGKALSALVVSHNISEAVYLSDILLVLSNRPATILRSFTIDLPRPRNPQIRLSDKFWNVLRPVREYALHAWR